MARIGIAGTSGASENSIVFSPAGGHSHNGRNSSLIDSTAYSIYDFSPTFVGTEVNPDRAVRQENNRIAFEDVIKRVVNNSVLAPAGIRLEPGSLNGSLIIANTITANQLAANTITAAEISAGTITANELSSNIVLINNRIVSQNWNGTIQANGTIFSNGIGSTGWAITNTHAVFDSTLIRGSIAANSLLTPNLTISNTGAITSTNFNVTAGGNITATNANITGNIVANSVSTGGVSISNTGAISSANFNVTAVGNVSATNANIAGAITATTLTATTSGRIGPFDLTNTSLKSTSYNAQNYMEILNYGDMYIYSAPLSGPHAGMRHTTAMIGETIVIGRDDLPTSRYSIMGSDAAWGAGNVGFGIVENNSSVFEILQNGNMYFTGTLNGYSFTSGRHSGGNQMVHTDGNGYLQVGYINSGDAPYNENNASSPDRVWGSNGGGDSYLRTYQTSSLSVAYAASAGSAPPALRLGRILDTTATSSGQDFIVANGNGTGMIRVAMNQEAYDKAVSGRTAVFNSNSLIGTTASTARLKQDIEAYTFNEQSILSMEPKRFRYNEKVEGGGDGSPWEYGFIAEEAVAAGLSELCGFDKDGLPDYFAYERMCIAQQQIIRTLWGKVESLQSRIQTLEGV